jgi:hypothetical protein
MNPKTIERTSEVACNLVMTFLSLALVAGYVCLYHVFKLDRQQSRAAVEQRMMATAGEQMTDPDAE